MFSWSGRVLIERMASNESFRARLSLVQRLVGTHGVTNLTADEFTTRWRRFRSRQPGHLSLRRSDTGRARCWLERSRQLMDLRSESNDNTTSDSQRQFEWPAILELDVLQREAETVVDPAIDSERSPDASR